MSEKRFGQMSIETLPFFSDEVGPFFHIVFNEKVDPARIEVKLGGGFSKRTAEHLLHQAQLLGHVAQVMVQAGEKLAEIEEREAEEADE